MKLEIHRVSCRGCGKIFQGFTLEEAKAKHKIHIKTCDKIIAIKKVERFRKKCEKILGRKMSFSEASEILKG